MSTSNSGDIESDGIELTAPPGNISENAAQASDQASSSSGGLAVGAAGASTSTSGTNEDKIKNYIATTELYDAALDGNWEAANEIIKKGRVSADSVISRNGSTALHISVEANHMDFAKKLVLSIGADEERVIQYLRKQNSCSTAFVDAVAWGSFEMTNFLYNKCPELVLITDNLGRKPICHAEKHKMVYHLWELSDLDEVDKSFLLPLCIDKGIYDKVFEILDQSWHLARELEARREEFTQARPCTILHLLACKSSLEDNDDRSFIEKLVSKRVGKKCHVQQELRKLFRKIWTDALEEGDFRTDDNLLEFRNEMRDLGIAAAESGNVVFLSELIRLYPDVIYRTDISRRTIFHKAAMRRQADIMRLLYKKGSIKQFVLSSADGDRNVLHWVAELGPAEKLNEITGPALQMQSELQWYKEIEKIMPPKFTKKKDKDTKTPWEVFKEQHSKMREDGEEWMKRTAQYSMLVAALIATVTFTASFTIPGGYGDDGKPHLSINPNKCYIAFTVTTTISFVSSIISMIMFLSVLTSSYAEETFLYWLPLRLLLGLATLLIACGTMVGAFSITLFLPYEAKRPIYKLMLGLLLTVPICFTVVYAKLGCDICSSLFSFDYSEYTDTLCSLMLRTWHKLFRQSYRSHHD